MATAAPLVPMCGSWSGGEKPELAARRQYNGTRTGPAVRARFAEAVEDPAGTGLAQETPSRKHERTKARKKVAFLFRAFALSCFRD